MRIFSIQRSYFRGEDQKQVKAIGLVLCTKKSDAMVKYRLGKKNEKIFARKHQFHLPGEEELEAELKREMRLIEEQMKIEGLLRTDK